MFITHSLGGLVCEDALLHSKNSPHAYLQSIVNCTVGIVFLGTPHSGSSLANPAEKLCKLFGLFKTTAVEIVQVLRRESEVLARIQTSFQTMVMTISREAVPIEITCFYEQVPMSGLLGLVVPQSSAILPAYPHIGIRANHRNIARFDSKDDPGFVAISSELQRWAKSSEQALNTSIRISQRHENDWQVLYIHHNPHVNFIGRQTVLLSLENRFRTERCVALSGIGGIGKSEIAIEFCYDFQKRKPGSSIFWVPADTASKFEQAYTEIAEELGLRYDRDTVIDTTLELVRRYLSRSDTRPYVMVIDSADDVDTLTIARGSPQSPRPPLMSYIPSSPTGKVIVTTRDHHVGQVLMNWNNPIRVESLSPEDAKLMFCSTLSEKVTTNDKVVQHILEILDFLPLAITQAAAYVKRNNISLEQYHHQLTENDTLRDFLNEKQFDSRRGFESVIRSWKISFDDIHSKNVQAAELLAIMFLLNREGIPRELLRQTGQSEHQLTTALGMLQNFSLVKEDRGAATYSMHRLVQFATTSWLELEDSKVLFQQRTLKMVADKFPPPESEDFEVSRLLVPHARAVESFAPENDESKISLAQLQFRMASHYKNEGFFNEAEESCRKALQAYVSSYGRYSTEALRTSELLGLIVVDQGFFDEALTIHEDNVRHKETLLGPNHLETIKSVSDLADVQCFRGKFADAVILGERVLRARTAELGPEHPETISSLRDLAHLKTSLEKLEEAEQLAQSAYTTSEKVLGLNHPLTLACATVLASVHRSNGRYSETLQLNLIVVDQRTKVLGEKHPHTLTACNDVGLAYRLLGDFDRAEELLRRVVEQQIHTFGVNNIDTIMSTYNLARVLTERGKFDEAKLLSISTLKQRLDSFGKDNPTTLKHQIAHANLLDKAGEHEEALEMADSALEAMKRVLGDSHSEVFNSMWTLASILHRKGDLDRAAMIFEDALQGSLQMLRKNHPLTLACRFSLGLVYEDNSRLEEALQQFKECVEGTLDEYGEKHKLSTERLEKMGDVERHLLLKYKLSLKRPAGGAAEKCVSFKYIENVGSSESSLSSGEEKHDYVEFLGVDFGQTAVVRVACN